MEVFKQKYTQKLLSTFGSVLGKIMVLRFFTTFAWWAIVFSGLVQVRRVLHSQLKLPGFVSFVLVAMTWAYYLSFF